MNISFFGGMGSGKSTGAKYLAAKHGYTHVPMANALKDAAEVLWGPEARVSRDKLQKLGKYIREIDPDTLLNTFAAEIAHPIGNVVTDDMRYENEYWGLKERDFVMVKVIAEESKRVDRLLRNGKLDDVSQLEDETETQLEKAVADFTIFNDDDEDYFYKQIESVLAQVEAKA